MENKTAQALGPLVKTPKYYKPLMQYTEERIEFLRNQLETAAQDEVKRIQGQLFELRKFKELKDRATGIIQNGN